MYYIYEMRHTPTGRVYVGQRKLPKGKTPETDDYMGSGKLWKRIYKAHPEECVKTILAVVENKEEVNELEKKFIAHYRELYGNKCVNVADGGDGGWSHANTAEVQARSIEHRRGLKRSPETCKRISDSLRGKKLSESTRKKMSESRKGRVSPMKGKKHSESAKRKIGQTIKITISKKSPEEISKSQRRERDANGRFVKGKRKALMIECL